MATGVVRPNASILRRWGSEGSRSNRLERDGPAVHWPTEKEKDAIGCGDQLLSGEVGQVDQRIEWDMPELANVFQKDAVRREAEQCAVGDRGQSIVVARHNPAKVCGLETARFVAVRGRVPHGAEHLEQHFGAVACGVHLLVRSSADVCEAEGPV